MQKGYGLACRHKFWSIAKARTKEAFDQAMEELREMKQEAYEYLNAIPHNQWASYAFPTARYGHITSNAVESLNAAWIDYRSLPVLPLLTSLWAYVMRTTYARRHQTHKSLRITDVAKERLDEAYRQACRFCCYLGDHGLVQVFIPDGVNFIVNLCIRTCTCTLFQEYGMPCEHAVAAALHQADDPYDYVLEAYTIESYRLMYSRPMHPLNDQNLALNERCQAPHLAKQRGRPKKCRYRSAGERARTRPLTCSHCHQQGHNRWSCRNAAVA